MKVVEHDQRPELERWIHGAAGGARDYRCSPQLLERPDVGAVGDLLGAPDVARPVTASRRACRAVRAGHRGRTWRGLGGSRRAPAAPATRASARRERHAWTSTRK